MLGLAAVAAMALMAFIGAGSASASELCSTNTAPCTGTMYPEKTAISAKLKGSTVATLTTSTGTVRCAKSTVGGETTNTGTTGEAVFGTITSLTFTECKLAFFFTCSIASVGLPATAEVAATGGGKGSMTVTEDGSGEPGATVECFGGGLNCTFTTPDITLDVNGGNPAIVVASQEELVAEGTECPTEVSKWDAEYEVTAPKPLFVVHT